MFGHPLLSASSLLPVPSALCSAPLPRPPNKLLSLLSLLLPLPPTPLAPNQPDGSVHRRVRVPAARRRHRRRPRATQRIQPRHARRRRRERPDRRGHRRHVRRDVCHRIRRFPPQLTRDTLCLWIPSRIFMPISLSALPRAPVRRPLLDPIPLVSGPRSNAPRLLARPYLTCFVFRLLLLLFLFHSSLLFSPWPLSLYRVALALYLSRT
ncbi:hypothetical protein B0H15DRAFT_847088 [Mycena belliarum]|uniref:Uncharacterized protein n=1 Tax=Mycena belliarum TaxID=1033014 RepID=A0AAD6XPP0_9AGAR|nr:hypothetical protein B0H15DRAFT_847088 [Mycena belliae]